MNEFTDLKLNHRTIDLYLVRNAILGSIKRNAHYFHGTFLDLGCGNMPYRDLIINGNNRIEKYIGLDLEGSEFYTEQKPDLFWDGTKIPLPNASVNTVMATEVFEHVPQLNIVLNEIYRVLKVDGILFFTVPFLWPLHDVPYDEYRYTPFSIERKVKEAGLEILSLHALGGWNAGFAQMLGLWVRRKPMNRFKRALLSRILLPVFKSLVKNDEVPEAFSENLMITGLMGVAIKKQ